MERGTGGQMRCPATAAGTGWLGRRSFSARGRGQAECLQHQWGLLAAVGRPSLVPAWRPFQASPPHFPLLFAVQGIEELAGKMAEGLYVIKYSVGKGAAWQDVACCVMHVWLRCTGGAPGRMSCVRENELRSGAAGSRWHWPRGGTHGGAQMCARLAAAAGGLGPGSWGPPAAAPWHTEQLAACQLCGSETNLRHAHLRPCHGCRLSGRTATAPAQWSSTRGSTRPAGWPRPLPSSE